MADEVAAEAGRSPGVPRTVEDRPDPPVMHWLCGLLVGMQVEAARKIGASARADVEPTIGPLGGTILEWVVFLAWIMLIAWFVGWFLRRRWVRTAFESAQRRRSSHAAPGPSQGGELHRG